MHNLSLARERAEDEIAKRQKYLQGSKVEKTEHTETFKLEDHQKVTNVKPFVRQILADLKTHAIEINPSTANY